MIEFINENERPTLSCSGIFISIRIARLMCRSISHYLNENPSECDEDILSEFLLLIQNKLDCLDHETGNSNNR